MSGGDRQQQPPRTPLSEQQRTPGFWQRVANRHAASSKMSASEKLPERPAVAAYRVGESVQYWSKSRGRWLDTVVKNFCSLSSDFVGRGRLDDQHLDLALDTAPNGVVPTARRLAKSTANIDKTTFAAVPTFAGGGWGGGGGAGSMCMRGVAVERQAGVQGGSVAGVERLWRGWGG